MSIIPSRTLPNGVEISLDKDNLQMTYDNIITKFVMPYYEESNDWNKTLKLSISELEAISQILKISKGHAIESFLKRIEERLDQDFEKLKGTDKIEILFEALDDYVQNLTDIIENHKTKEEIRLNIAKLVENLNLFEISELILYYAQKDNKKN